MYIFIFSFVIIYMLIVADQLPAPWPLKLNNNDGFEGLV
jgi:hypothetical protein